MNAQVLPFEPRIERIEQRFKSIAIVPYEPKYLEETLAIAREIHAHSIYAAMPMDEPKLIQQLAGSGVVFNERYFKLAVRKSDVLGGFYGTILRTFFSNTLVTKDMGWWVKSTARGSAAAILLLSDFVRWSRAMGAVKCTIGQSGVENLERTGKLFQHCGFTFSGFNAARDL